MEIRPVSHDTPAAQRRFRDMSCASTTCELSSVGRCQRASSRSSAVSKWIASVRLSAPSSLVPTGNPHGTRVALACADRARANRNMSSVGARRQHAMSIAIADGTRYQAKAPRSFATSARPFLHYTLLPKRELLRRRFGSDELFEMLERFVGLVRGAIQVHELEPDGALDGRILHVG